jgi:hypothetical protein
MAENDQPTVRRPSGMLIISLEGDLLVVTPVRVDKVYLKVVSILTAVGNPVSFR